MNVCVNFLSPLSQLNSYNDNVTANGIFVKDLNHVMTLNMKYNAPL